MFQAEELLRRKIQRRKQQHLAENVGTSPGQGCGPEMCKKSA
jgi:hypothetical protein